MYERFTDRARKVMQLANQEAQRFNHEYLGVEHILLGLVKEGGGVAAITLKNLGVDLRSIRLETEKLMVPAPAPGGSVPAGRLPHTPQAKRAIDAAVAEARSLSHNYVGTEHILLGLVKEDPGVAVSVLGRIGVSPGQVRQEVVRLWGESSAAEAAEAAEGQLNAGVKWAVLPVGYAVASVAPVSPLAAEVDQLARGRDSLRQLCGEIIATLTLPANREQVKALGGGFAMIVGSWERRFKECGGGS